MRPTATQPSRVSPAAEVEQLGRRRPDSQRI